MGFRKHTAINAWFLIKGLNDVMSCLVECGTGGIQAQCCRMDANEKYQI